MRDGAEGSRGAATLRNFVLRDETALRRMAAASPAPTGRGETAAPAAALADADVVKFDRMTADFTRSRDGSTSATRVIFNQIIGLTAQGFIDFARDRVDLNGTFVPAYELNNLVSNIPRGRGAARRRPARGHFRASITASPAPRARRR